MIFELDNQFIEYRANDLFRIKINQNIRLELKTFLATKEA